MNTQNAKIKDAVPLLMKADPDSPCIGVEGGRIFIKGGTVFNGVAFENDTTISFGTAHPQVGGDFAVFVDGEARIALLKDVPVDSNVLGGFHFAPGGNATGREGGDETPAVNPYSIWDRNFRPACPDPRGMARIEMPGKKFWCDIYLLGVDHMANGTSKLGVKIADGNDCPQEFEGAGFFDALDYRVATAVLKHHGKQLLGAEEFFAAAYGVTERSSHDGDPVSTKLDAKRTSRFGIMQATGNLWVWGTDGHPDDPRPSIFGGSWVSGSSAGSRYADLDSWPGVSSGNLGARGRSDHLQLG